MIDIISVSDEEVTLKNREHKNYDLLIGCGDLSPGYMDYVNNEFKPSLSIMVHGNHDKKYFPEVYKEENEKYSDIYKGFLVLNKSLINLKRYIKKDINIMAFSGALSYGIKPFHISEKDTAKFKRDINIKMLLKRIKNIDIVATHNPPLIENTIKKFDRYHIPSKNFGDMYKQIFPKLWLYGHIHRAYTINQLDFKLRKENMISYMINSVPYQKIKYDEEKKIILEIKRLKATKTKEIVLK